MKKKNKSSCESVEEWCLEHGFKLKKSKQNRSRYYLFSKTEKIVLSVNNNQMC